VVPGEDHPVLAVATALTGLGVEVVVTVTATDRAAVGSVPAGVRVVVDLPLQVVLPSCAVSINAGGAGSVLTAVANGVPQLILPQSPTHVFNAERVAAAGAGLHLRTHQLDLDDLVTSVASLVSGDHWRSAADALQRENLAQPPLSEAVRLIEELV
jgi:UDP:flavonoid glycosyltransferase YjiC (YdhE family)